VSAEIEAAKHAVYPISEGALTIFQVGDGLRETLLGGAANPFHSRIMIHRQMDFGTSLHERLTNGKLRPGIVQICGRLPDISVPVATYTGYAYRAPVAGDPVPMVDGCDASGQRIPFLETQAERTAAGDPRLSIQERYPDHTTYVNRVTTAAQQLQAQRLMLEMDVQAYIAAAQAASIP
jgi:hypothetical protein